MATQWLAALALALALALTAGAPAPGACEAGSLGRTRQDPPRPTPDDAALRAAWKGLAAAERREVLEWTRAELEFEGSFQGTLLRHALAKNERPESEWPRAGEPPIYDPKVHAPAQPIPRRRLAPESAKARELRARIFRRVPERRLDSAWSYDYGTRELARSERVDDLDRIFENLLRGFPPGLDLAEALVERALDDGAQQRALAAFGHAYSDRAGAVAPGITLYDAWCSGIEMEMPDVECLGVVHDVLEDWSTWRAPVPSARHRALYARLGELFGAAHRHRSLRHALARTYLSAHPALRDGHAPHLERFHAIWDHASSDPARLSLELAEAQDEHGWLARWIERLKESPELLERGRVRQAALAADQRRVREVLALVLELSGAMGH